MHVNEYHLELNYFNISNKFRDVHLSKYCNLSVFVYTQCALEYSHDLNLDSSTNRCVFHSKDKTSIALNELIHGGGCHKSVSIVTFFTFKRSYVTSFLYP